MGSTTTATARWTSPEVVVTVPFNGDCGYRGGGPNGCRGEGGGCITFEAQTITVFGTIAADGEIAGDNCGGGGGSGGTIRLLADTILVAAGGEVHADGGAGDDNDINGDTGGGAAGAMDLWAGEITVAGEVRTRGGGTRGRAVSDAFGGGAAGGGAPALGGAGGGGGGSGGPGGSPEGGSGNLGRQLRVLGRLVLEGNGSIGTYDGNEVETGQVTLSGDVRRLGPMVFGGSHLTTHLVAYRAIRAEPDQVGRSGVAGVTFQLRTDPNAPAPGLQTDADGFDFGDPELPGDMAHTLHVSGNARAQAATVLLSYGADDIGCTLFVHPQGDPPITDVGTFVDCVWPVAE